MDSRELSMFVGAVLCCGTIFSIAFFFSFLSSNEVMWGSWLLVLIYG